MTPDNPEPNTMLHITIAETADLISGSSRPDSRASIHVRACSRCLERLAVAIEDAVLDEQDFLDCELDPDGRVDVRPLRRFLRSAEPVVRAAAARAIVSLSIDDATALEELSRLAAEPDRLVSATAAGCLRERAPGPAASMVERTKAAAAGLLGSFTVPTPVLGSVALAAHERVETRDDLAYETHAGELTIGVAHDAGLVHITMSTVNPEIGAATVRFVLLDDVSRDDESAEVIELSLRKLADEQRWMATWMGPSVHHDRFVRIREVEPRA